MTAIVHGWCGFVEKSPEVVSQLMVLNKLWIPDVLIDIIKDFLYISAAEVLRKFYRFNLNSSITDLTTMSSCVIDVYGRQRLAHWAKGHVYGGGDVQIQGVVCVTCGEADSRHQNVNGCCALEYDEVDPENGLLYLVDDDVLVDESLVIPEVTWDIDIPVASQQVNEDSEYDIEAQIADYAEYMREAELAEYVDILGR